MIAPMAEPPTTIREMTHEDLSMVSDIERRSYEFPWSHGVFRDCLLAGYQNIVLVRGDEVAGYGVLSVAAGEELDSSASSGSGGGATTSVDGLPASAITRTAIVVASL